jgi:DNA-binding HxlR family transcriptional regulator
MALLDLLGRRMTLRILWELREAHLVEHGAEGYALTAHGQALLKKFLPLHVWADDWTRLFGGKGRKTRGRSE